MLNIRVIISKKGLIFKPFILMNAYICQSVMINMESTEKFNQTEIFNETFFKNVSRKIRMLMLNQISEISILQSTAKLFDHLR